MNKIKTIFKKIIFLSVFLTLVVVIQACRQGGLEIRYLNGEMAIVTNKKAETILVNEKEIALHQTTSELVALVYETCNLDNDYDNTIVINQKRYPLKAKDDTQNAFVENKLELLSPIINDRLVTVKINSGMNNFGNFDNFLIMNIRLLIGKDEIWPVDMSKEEYENVDLKLGGPNLQSPYRSNYQNEVVLTYQIPDKYFNRYGAYLTDVWEEKLIIKEGNVIKEVDNPAYLKVDFVTPEGVKDDFVNLKVDGQNISNYHTYIDQVLVKNDLVLSPHSWAPGKHELKVVVENKNGFTKELSSEFELSDKNLQFYDNDLKIYETGVHQEFDFSSEINGVEVLDLTKEIKSPFSKITVQKIQITFKDKLAFTWQGLAPQGRTVKLYAYNYETNHYEVVSVAKVKQKDQLITLGFDFEKTQELVKDQKATCLVVSQNYNQKLKYDHQMLHITDTQYIVQNASTAKGDVIKKRAVEALNSLKDYVINAYETGNVIYSMLTGDFVQTVKYGAEEWPVFMDEFMQPLLDKNYPLGVVSGNHDVGGAGDWSKNGTNALDDELNYEYMEKYLGDHVFESQPWFYQSYQNNRSHADKITINGIEYLFLYLGWGSHKKGYHISKQDINWGETVLKENPGVRTILLAHEYLNNRGERTLCGQLVWDQLIVPYPNIEIVLCGHINGASHRIDLIDDNRDGIADRRVFQQLTNFQEEEDLFGATFLRILGLDYTQNQIGFELYSPYYNDTDLKFINTKRPELVPGIVKANRNLIYDFDLNNLGYGLITKRIR